MSSRSSFSSKKSDADVNPNATQEYKYERVEKVDVDKEGRANLKDVREGTGREDPALNFTPHPPEALVPGAPSGLAPGMSGQNIAPKIDIVRDSSDINRSGYGQVLRESEFIKGPTNMEGIRHHGSSHSAHSSSRVESDTQFAATQRTAPMGVQREILVEGTGTGKVQEHHEREVFKHEATTREAHEEIITVPVTHTSTTLESVREGATFTTDKPLTIPAPQIAPQLQPACMEIHLGGASAEIHANQNFELTEAEIKQMGPEEYDRYRRKVEKLARLHEFETAQKAAEYRAEVERDAELIRRTLERQHMRDIDFRKEMIESNIERQEREIQLEAEYAMRVLEAERAAARQALEKAKGESNIEVNIDSAVGTTHSVGHIATASSTERSSEEMVSEKSRMATEVRSVDARPA